MSNIRIGTLLAGLLTGIIGGIGGTHYFNSRAAHTEAVSKRPADIHYQQLAVANKTKSPFSVSQKTASDDPSVKPGVNQLNAEVILAETALIDSSSLSLINITHYHDAIAALQAIDTADSDQLLEFSQQISKSRFEDSFAQAMHTAIYQRWAEVDIDTAIDHALAAMEYSSRKFNNTHWASEGLAVISAEQPAYLQSKVEQLTANDPHSEISRAIYRGIATNDPEQFARYALSMESENQSARFGGTSMLSTAIFEWGSIDPQAAFAWLKQEASDEQWATHQGPLLYRWFEQDPDAAFIEVEALINDGSAANFHNTTMLSELYTRHLATSDPSAAMQWVMSQENIHDKENILMGMMYTLGETNPDAAQNLFSQFNFDEYPQLMPMAVQAVANSMGMHDPQSAMAWADQLPDNQAIEARISIVSHWSYTDPAAALEWLTQLPDTQENIQIFSMAAHSLMNSGDPETLKQLYPQLPPQTQTELAEMVTLNLARRSEQDTREWLNTQANSEVRQIGNIVLDSMGSETDTFTVLENIAGLQSDSKQSLLFNTLGQRMLTDKAGVEQWLSGTTLLTGEEHDMINQVLQGSSGHYNMPYIPGGYYSREGHTTPNGSQILP